jgi:alkylation response protein AidB-like acyl-CoA dehydrogenase
MEGVETQRTLVKSVPELWAELSENALLGRLLAEPFGEIRITRLRPETSIEWESELAVGAVELEPSGLGTRVRLTAQIAESAEPAAEPHPEGRREGLLARLLRHLRAAPPPAEPEPEPDDGAEPTVAPLDGGTARRALTAVLDEIGTARHRPFSRQPTPPPR